MVDLRISFRNGVSKCFQRIAVPCPEVVHRNLFRCDAAGQFPLRMGAHAVGDHKQMAAGPKTILRLGRQANRRILIVRPSHTDITEFSEDYSRIPVVRHRKRLLRQVDEKDDLLRDA